MARILTADEGAVLAHAGVKNPQEWLDHAVATFGETMGALHLTAKIARWRPEYEAAIATEGAAYKSGAQRRTEARAAFVADAEARRAARPKTVSNEAILDLLDAHGSPALKAAVAAARGRG